MRARDRREEDPEQPRRLRWAAALVAAALAVAVAMLLTYAVG